ncbi:MAG: hypothetical protein JNK30_02685 [Phenylobacterium sp.]|nr:hypothetical protein [Phenylobacterium sp.]MBL8770263.1 hypothetical protein [Phenylobacterium sp.]
MTRSLKPGGPPYVPSARGGLVDPRSTGGPPSVAPRPVLMDRRSTR